MKKYNLSQIMKRAWVLFKGNIAKSFSEALKKSWSEVKEVAKKVFANKATVSILNSFNGEEKFYFTKWENYGKKRIYFQDSQSAKANIKGYIDLSNNEVIITNARYGKADETLGHNAVSAFLAQYAI